MAIERKILPVPSQLFTSDGTVYGELTVDRSDLFKVRQRVFIKAVGESTNQYEVKRIIKTSIFVGPLDNDLDSRSDISLYTVIKNSSIFANEQLRPFLHDGEDLSIPHDVNDIEHEEEPVLGKRVILVDGFGERIESVTTGGIRRLGVDVSGITVSGVNVDPDPSSASINNIDYPTSGVEQSWVVPDDTRKFEIRVRDMDANMRIAFSSGDTSIGPYFTIRRGCSFWEDNIKTNGITVYFQIDKSSQTVEILTWY